MANNFLRVEYDKFSNKRVTSMSAITLLEMGLSSYFKINLRHVSTPETEVLLIDLLYSGWDWFDLDKGILIININDIENIELKPHGTYEGGEPDKCYEDYYYEINKEILKKICDAKSVDFQIQGKRGKRIEEANGDRFIKYAQIFYNGFYDEELYKEVIDENEDDIERLLPYSEENETESGNSCMVTLLIMCTALSSVAACLIILFHYL